MTSPLPAPPVVLAAMAHPDDIEFCCSGTLLLLKAAGCPIHMWNLANGHCGTTALDRVTIIRIRGEEARASAALAGAACHPPLFDDLAVFYDKPSLAAVSAVVRSIRPQIILTHPVRDYMEDHQNVARLVTTAAFGRLAPNFEARPASPVYTDPVRIYHAPPHGLRDGMDEPFRPDFLIEVESVMDAKRRMLACHESQNAWLDGTQEMGTPADVMQSLCRTLAAQGRGMKYAEGWRRHSHLGFCPADFDPLAALLGAFLQKTDNPS